MRGGHMSAALLRRLFAPVDVAPLVLARIAFGVLMVIEVIQYFVNDWIGRYYIEPSFLFRYPGFGWVDPLPGSGMYWLFAVLGVAAAMIAVGLWHRIAALVFAIGITWVFVLDQTHYLNHMYLICLFATQLAIVPLRRSSQTAPAWAHWLLAGQLAIVYIYGGIAKIDADWLAGIPAGVFLAGWEVTKPIADEPLVRHFFATGGMLFDLLVVPGLLWRRTRVLATLAAFAFHLTNSQLFTLGMFPWLMLATLPLFWPASASRWLLSRARILPREPPDLSPTPLPRHAAPIAAAFVAYAALQLLLPLRHWLYPGEVNWTEEGHNFSWHMKLRIKHAETKFIAHDPDTAETWTIDPRTQLTTRQVGKMGNRPEMVRQYAVELGRQLRDAGRPNVEIRVHAVSRLNLRPGQLLVDPRVDLSRVGFSLLPAPWIVPLGAKGAQTDAAIVAEGD
jgi:vitamin K-dependent gamma-carboxylase